jgi:hypothetical protein
MFHQYGRFKPLVMRKVGTVPSLRQLAPGAFVGTLGALLLAWPWVDGSGRILAGVASLYTGAALVAAARALRRHGTRCALALLVVFPTIHLAYGAGFLTGLVRLSGRGAGGRVPSDALPLSR